MTAKHNNINTPWLLAAALVLFWSSASQAGELQVLLTDADGQPVPEAVIEIVSPTVALPANWPLTGVMDQMDKEFIGPLLMVVKNSLVSFPNSDDIHHHVYSFSETKRFELPLYTGNTATRCCLITPAWWSSGAIFTTGWWVISTWVRPT